MEEPRERSAQFERHDGEFGVERVPMSERASWAAIVARGFANGNEPDAPAGELYSVVGHAASNECWIARADGKPAGAGCMGMRERVASLATTCVLPEFRRRGVHAALIATRLAFAVQSGARLARIACQPGSASERNILRQGFALAYTRSLFDLPSASRVVRA